MTVVGSGVRQEAGPRGTPPVARAGQDWLRLREPADGVARSVTLVALVRRAVRAAGSLVVHDLGSGTGSMARWLAPRLPAPQRWVLHDRDTDLLDAVADRPPPVDGDGARVALTTRGGDLTRLGPDGLVGASLVTASALLDMLTAEEVERVVATCLGAGCPALLSLSVVGRVRFAPAEPLDARFAAAFDAHQRRRVGDHRLVGPDAAGLAARAARERGARVVVAASPWRLGLERAGLVDAWLTGWLGAAVEQEPTLLAEAEGYAQRRRDALAQGRLRVLVDHVDLLLLPAAGEPSRPRPRDPSMDGTCP